MMVTVEPGGHLTLLPSPLAGPLNPVVNGRPFDATPLPTTIRFD